MKLRPPTLLAFLILAALGCESREYQPPSEEEKVAQAESAFATSLFDTIGWDSDSVRIATGNLVFATECRRCHGSLGRGDTEYARENDLTVPSLVEPDWDHAGEVDSVRYRIFVGHATGMPNWGVGRLSPRQIDAAAAYILQQLRPEVLADSARVPGASR